ncbi:MAG: hypothetical protein C0P67_014500, partial [Bacillota bacterium]
MKSIGFNSYSIPIFSAMALTRSMSNPSYSPVSWFRNSKGTKLVSVPMVIFSGTSPPAGALLPAAAGRNAQRQNGNQKNQTHSTERHFHSNAPSRFRQMLRTPVMIKNGPEFVLSDGSFNLKPSVIQYTAFHKASSS